MSNPMRMRTAAAVIAASVLLSRILGLARDALIATLFGTSVDADLYNQAFLIPDFLNYLLAGAYLTITLVPILSRHLETGDGVGASRSFTSVFRFVTIAILALTALMWALAGPLVDLVFPETSDPARLVTMTRIVLPAQVFLVTGALLMAVQYTHKRFVIPATAPLIYNLGIIAGGLVGAALGDPSPESFLVGAVVGAALGNFGIQWFGAKRTGTWFTSIPRGESSVGEYLVLAIPLMIGQSVAVLDEQFVKLFAQVDVGATAALSYARRLNMVPVGVIAQAAGVAAFPFLAGLFARGAKDELIETTGRAARKTIFVAAAATAGLVVLARPLVRLVYQYGEFSLEDAELVATLLVIYAFSIPAWGLHQLLARHFYAKRKMWTPVLVGTSFSILAVPAWLGLYRAMGVEGFALASTLVMIAYALGLLVAWGYDSGWAAVRRLAPAFLRSMVSATLAGGVGWYLADLMIGDDPITVVSGLVVTLVAGLTTLAVFLGVSRLLRSPEMSEVLRR
ncbi:MAG TPA: murein biosynthesis integral membrane protein MurJ [Acidimicrobiia bacterium]|nr:murein biosynthesis integral membrane protein MurJ [Acidimicrobiia bacterium]